MTIEREVTIAGQTYPVILSDENEALQAAKAAGRAIVGLWRENEEKQPADYSSWISGGSWLKLTSYSSFIFPWTIRCNRIPLCLPTELFLIGTSARNTGNTSTALPSAVCGRWNAARTVCWLERRG